MIEEYCDGRVLDKGPVRMSNWECVPLSREQLDCEHLQSPLLPGNVSCMDCWLTIVGDRCGERRTQRTHGVPPTPRDSSIERAYARPCDALE